MLTLTLCLLDQELGDQIIKCLLYLEPAADLLFTIPQFHNMFYWQQCSHFVNNPCPYCGPHWESGFGRQLTYNHVQICLRSPDMISRSLELPFCRAATDHGGESGSSRLIWWGEALSVRASHWGRGETGNADSTRAHSHSLCSCLFLLFRPFIWEDATTLAPERKCDWSSTTSLSSYHRRRPSQYFLKSSSSSGFWVLPRCWPQRKCGPSSRTAVRLLLHCCSTPAAAERKLEPGSKWRPGAPTGCCQAGIIPSSDSLHGNFF